MTTMPRLRRPATRGRRSLAALAVLLCAAGCANALTAGDTPAQRQLLAAEDALFAADVSRNAAVVQQGFADEATFVHANGMVQDKAAYLQAMQHGPGPSAVRGTDRTVVISGDIGIVRGTKQLSLGTLQLSGTYLSVYVMRDGRWQLLDEQSAPAYRPHADPH